MNGKKDIDPASEDLREDDEDVSLPELDLTTDQPEGTLAAGRAAIARAVKHAPSAPGVSYCPDHAARAYRVLPRGVAAAFPLVSPTP